MRREYEPARARTDAAGRPGAAGRVLVVPWTDPGGQVPICSRLHDRRLVHLLAVILPRAPTATGVGVSPRRVREPRVLFVSSAPRRFANHQWASGKPTQPLVGAACPSGPPRPGQGTPIIAIGRGAVVIVIGD